jgi:hypothetical protein
MHLSVRNNDSTNSSGNLSEFNKLLNAKIMRMLQVLKRISIKTHQIIEF